MIASDMGAQTETNAVVVHSQRLVEGVAGYAVRIQAPD